MNLDTVVQYALNIAGTFGPTLIVILFIICLLGEFHIAIPYLLETIWLLAGYNVGSGDLTPWALLLMWTVAQAGRQAGTMTLFYLTRLGSTTISRLYQKHFGVSLAERSACSDAVAFRLWRRVGFLSPLSVAAGRLMWLRIPMTLTLGLQKRFKPLFMGVVLAGLVWDGILISIGLIGGLTPLTKSQMLLTSFAGLTLFYATTLTIRQIKRLRCKAHPTGA